VAQEWQRTWSHWETSPLSPYYDSGRNQNNNKNGERIRAMTRPFELREGADNVNHAT